MVDRANSEKALRRGPSGLFRMPSSRPKEAATDALSKATNDEAICSLPNWENPMESAPISSPQTRSCPRSTSVDRTRSEKAIRRGPSGLFRKNSIRAKDAPKSPTATLATAASSEGLCTLPAWENPLESSAKTPAPPPNVQRQKSAPLSSSLHSYNSKTVNLENMIIECDENFSEDTSSSYDDEHYANIIESLQPLCVMQKRRRAILIRQPTM